MDLPAASPLITYALEAPRFPAALLLIAAAFVWFALRPRFPRPAAIAALSLAGAAAGLVALAALVETTGERLTRQTRLLVETALAGDSAAVGDLLHEGVVLRVGSDRSSLGRADLLRRIPALKEVVRSNHIRQVQAARTGRDGGESVLAQTTTPHLGAPTANEWRFRWTREADGRWRITEMIWERWAGDAVPTISLINGR